MDKENIKITIEGNDDRKCLVDIDYNENGDNLMDINVKFEPEGIDSDDRTFYSAIVDLILSELIEDK